MCFCFVPACRVARKKGYKKKDQVIGQGYNAKKRRKLSLQQRQKKIIHVFMNTRDIILIGTYSMSSSWDISFISKAERLF